MAELNWIFRDVQNCFAVNPVIVLGSGASAPYGLRGMPSLAEHLLRSVSPLPDEQDDWLLVRTALNAGDGLEEVLLRNQVSKSLVEKIVKATWEAITADDLDLLTRAASTDVHFGLSSYLASAFRSTHQVVSIVTTNYDRVAEYACDLADYWHDTGFSHGIIRRRSTSEVLPYQGQSFARRVRIWKVHGSLDWFADSDGVPLCLPLSSKIPRGFQPLIVTPGESKFERTHDEPFRSAIQGADQAIANANGIICVGYGFRDKHIQPKIIERCKGQGAPIVVISKKLTDEAREFLEKFGGANWIALEEHDEATKVYSANNKDGFTIDGEHWTLSGLNNMIS